MSSSPPRRRDGRRRSSTRRRNGRSEGESAREELRRQMEDAATRDRESRLNSERARARLRKARDTVEEVAKAEARPACGGGEARERQGKTERCRRRSRPAQGRIPSRRREDRRRARRAGQLGKASRGARSHRVARGKKRRLSCAISRRKSPRAAPSSPNAWARLPTSNVRSAEAERKLEHARRTLEACDRESTSAAPPRRLISSGSTRISSTRFALRGRPRRRATR